MTKDIQEKTPATAEEQINLKIEILSKVSDQATAGLGLVAALAWNEAIQAIFGEIFPKPGQGILPKIIYALLITVIIVFITYKLGRMVNLAKKQLSREKK